MNSNNNNALGRGRTSWHVEYHILLAVAVNNFSFSALNFFEERTATESFKEMMTANRMAASLRVEIKEQFNSLEKPLPKRWALMFGSMNSKPVIHVFDTAKYMQVRRCDCPDCCGVIADASVIHPPDHFARRHSLLPSHRPVPLRGDRY